MSAGDSARAVVGRLVSRGLSGHHRFAAVWAVHQRIHDRERRVSLRGHFVAGGLFLLLLGIVFIGMGATVLAVVQGVAPPQQLSNGYHDSASTVVPILLFMALVLCLGLYIPPPLEALLREAAALVEGTP